MMRTSDRGRALIETCEGLRTTAYLDGADIPTIGYGHTAGVRLGDACTPEQADAWLADDLTIAEEAVNRLVEMQLSQNEFDALASFTFNCGGGALGTSTLLRLLNVGEIAAAAAEFPRWVHDARGNVEPGLVTRRAMERALFEEKDDEQGS